MPARVNNGNDPVEVPPGQGAASGGRSVLALTAYLIVVFLGGALLAPHLWRAVVMFAPESSLAAAPFHRFVHRSIYFLALVGLWPLLRTLQVRRWSEIGIAWLGGSPGELARGLALGFGSLAVAALVITTGHARIWDGTHTSSEWSHHLINAIFAALAAGLLEELLFRGALFAPFRRQGGFVIAAAVSAFVYALTHFFRPVHFNGAIEWTSGLTVLGLMCGGFMDWQALVPAFFNLALAGWALALARERTGTLWFSIGLHAGWIFWVKSFAFLTRGQPLSDVWIWGSGKLIDGWLAMLVLVAVIPMVYRLTAPRKSIRA